MLKKQFIPLAIPGVFKTNVVSLLDKCLAMKKEKKVVPGQKRNKTSPSQVLKEPMASYIPLKRASATGIYSYRKFEILSAKIPFTQREWASILHLSERTLQRNAKENKPFGGMYADRLQQIEKIFREAAIVFKKPSLFYNWLQQHPRVLNHTLSVGSLQTQDGIQLVLEELGRMQQGVYI